MGTKENDVIEVVLAQHKDVAERLSAVLNKTDSDRTEEFESLAKFLPVHEAAEQPVIYPALRALGEEGTRVAEARTREEGAASEEVEVLPLLNGATTLEQRYAMGEAFLAAQMGIPSHR
jgi:hemerythrin superfamily protein